jgi:hypothetical protein
MGHQPRSLYALSSNSADHSSSSDPQSSSLSELGILPQTQPSHGPPDSKPQIQTHSKTSLCIFYISSFPWSVSSSTFVSKVSSSLKSSVSDDRYSSSRQLPSLLPSDKYSISSSVYISVSAPMEKSTEVCLRLYSS